MTADDLPGVMAIERASFTSPWTPGTFTGLLRRDTTRLWVAETVGGFEPAVVGYAAVWMVADQAELGDLAVAGDWRRRGVGRALLEAVLAEMAAIGIRELFLEVRVSNRGARALYEAYGFERIGLREGYYSRPKEDALVLRRRIVPESGD